MPEERSPRPPRSSASTWPRPACCRRSPRAYLGGRDRDLLEPLRLLDPGELPPPGDPGARASAPTGPRLAAALGRANRSYGHPAADRLAGLLADPATEVVVTGQQPGLFGGPHYTLSQDGRRRALGGGDRGGRAGRRWPSSGSPPRTTTGPRSRPPPSSPPTARAASTWATTPTRSCRSGCAPWGRRSSRSTSGLAELRAADRFESWIETLRRIYRPDARFGEAFARLMVEILGERCPLLLDSMDPAVKAAEAPWLARLVEHRAAWEEASAAADRRIEERGHPLQVTPSAARARSSSCATASGGGSSGSGANGARTTTCSAEPSGAPRPVAELSRASSRTTRASSLPACSPARRSRTRSSAPPAGARPRRALLHGPGGAHLPGARGAGAVGRAAPAGAGAGEPPPGEARGARPPPRRAPRLGRGARAPARRPRRRRLRGAGEGGGRGGARAPSRQRRSTSTRTSSGRSRRPGRTCCARSTPSPARRPPPPPAATRCATAGSRSCARCAGPTACSRSARISSAHWPGKYGERFVEAMLDADGPRRPAAAGDRAMSRDRDAPDK